jgi:uncharacterized membrane protein HdeD (DUF308 family)
MSKKSKKTYPHNSGRALFILSGLIALILGYLLWNGIWNLEQVFAVILFIAGAFKIVVGLIR